MHTSIKVILAFFCATFAFSNTKASQRVEIAWQKPHSIVVKDRIYSKLYFDNALYSSTLYGNLPFLSLEKEVLKGMSLRVVSSTFIDLTADEMALVSTDIEFIPSQLLVQQGISDAASKWYAMARVLPFIKLANGSVQKLTSLEYEWNYDADFDFMGSKRNVETVSTSVLSSGDWYKIAITQDGVYKIGRSFLQNLGLSVNNIKPAQIHVYGYGAGMIEQSNAGFRYSDLPETPIIVQGESDGSFDANDFVIFYAQGPHRFKYSKSSDFYDHELNLYSDTSFYFININTSPPLRVGTTSYNGTADYITNAYDGLAYHETEDTSLINSGRLFYGELFDILTTQDFSFSMPKRIESEPVKMNITVAGRSSKSPSQHFFTASANGSNLGKILINSTDLNYYLAPFAHVSSYNSTQVLTGETININLNYNKPDVFSKAWLDKIVINARRRLEPASSQIKFCDAKSLNHNLTEYQLSGSDLGSFVVWEITDITKISEIPAVFNASNRLVFQAPGDTLRWFVAFTTDGLTEPFACGKIDNQNLHATKDVDMIIVTYPGFWTDANRLADFRRKFNGFDVKVVTTTEIYNEFSSGRQDITAIKDFARHVYKSSSTGRLPKYLLLFGEASFDYKNYINNNTNLVPTFQSINSTEPLGSYPCDLYFGVLGDNEGRFAEGDFDRMDMAVGRLLAGDADEAKLLVDKIITYEDPNNVVSLCVASTESSGDWKNIIAMIADDEDGNEHLSQTESISNIISSQYPQAIISKIYLDAYPQLSTPAGPLQPEVNTAINDKFNNGSLIVNYIGHGGTRGFADERILTIDDIASWNNIDKMPVMITATCEFSRYDNPKEISAGELIIKSETGGSAAMLTTVRTTFSGDNFALGLRLYRDNLFKKQNGVYPTLGEAVMNAVNPTLYNYNTRCFTLLGDPAMSLAYPKDSIYLNKINNVTISAVPDTLRALAKVSFEGVVSNHLGQTLSDFQGFVYPTVYDKPVKVTTLGNDVGSNIYVYSSFENIVYKGKATVKDGAYRFEFIVPKDIAYNYGWGRVNLYAEKNTGTDAAGYFNGFQVGGAATNVKPDDQGPTINLYMNDTKFIQGGITNADPIFLALIVDSSGINTTGNGIGHDLTAYLDNDANKTIVLNNFYQADLDNFQSGKVSYPLAELAPGPHTITFKAWDVHNNSATETLDFTVETNEEIIIQNLLNYPNPFTTNTTFHFDHNQSCQNFDAQIQVFTLTGKLVKTLAGEIHTTGFHDSSFTWDGLDEYGDLIGKGVYVYKLRVRTPNGDQKEVIQKLVLLR